MVESLAACVMYRRKGAAVSTVSVALFCWFDISGTKHVINDGDDAGDDGDAVDAVIHAHAIVTPRDPPMPLTLRRHRLNWLGTKHVHV